MSIEKHNIPQEFKDLPVQGRIEYVQDLWDFIVEGPEDIPVPESHKRILDERLAAYDAAADNGKPWAEVRENLLSKLRGS
jgi:putative addiction module component (TIGR02574 family)